MDGVKSKSGAIGAALSSILSVALACSLVPPAAWGQGEDTQNGSSPRSSEVSLQDNAQAGDDGGLADAASGEPSREPEGGSAEGAFDGAPESEPEADPPLRSSGNALEIVKKGSPVGEANAHDEFPITVELENDAGLSLEEVVVSDDDFIAAPASDPHPHVRTSAPSVSGIVDGVASAVEEASALPDIALDDLHAAALDDTLIALIDTGASSSANVVARYSVLGDALDDDSGHGTEMVDTIFSENPSARIMSVKALDGDGYGTAVGIYAAMKLALAHGAGILNLSLAARDTPANAVIAQGVADAVAAGAVVVVAAGNGGYDAKYFTPANVDAAITVGAASSSGTVRSESNRGACVDLFVEADSTSEAAARVTGWLSAHPGIDCNDDLEELPIAIDVGDGALRFDIGSGATVVDVVSDTVMAMAEKCNATGYMTLKLGSLGTCKISVTGVGSGDSKNYYKKTQTLKWSLKNTTGSYFKANSTTVKTTNQLRCLNQTATYYRYVTFPLTVKVPAGYHALNATREDSNGGACSTYNNTSADHTEKSWERTASNGGGNQSANDADRTVYVSINLTQTGLLYTTSDPAYHATYRLNLTGNDYTVAYNANGGTGAPTSTSHVYATASNLSTGKPTRANYTFTGWNTAANGSGTAYAAGQSVSTLAKAGTVTLYAQWRENPKYTVTYNGNGGTPGRASDTVYTGMKVTLPGATRAGYTFKGWSSSRTAASGATGSYTVTAAATLYATWQENNRVVSYNGNGGSPSKASDSVTPGKSVALPSVNAYPSGHNQDTGAACTVDYDASGGELGSVFEANTRARQYLVYGFSGWYTAPSGGTFVGSQNASYTPPFGTTSLYMQWSKSYPYRAVELPTPTREGYDFNGWSTTPGATSGVTGSYVPEGNVTLYATWSEQTHTVKFEANGATGAMPDQTAFAAHEWEVPEAAFSKEGYHATWNTAADGSGTELVPGMKVMIREDTTLFAQWLENTRKTVVVHPVAGQTVRLSGIPDRTSYCVTDGKQPARWHLVSSSPQSGVLSADEVKTVVSESAYEPCVVTFHANGGVGSAASETAFPGDALAVPACPFSFPGYCFIGWNTESDGRGSDYAPGEELVVRDDTELYAQWVTQAEWEARKHASVSYAAGGGSGGMPAESVEVGDAMTVPGCSFTRVGYAFREWNTAPDGSGRAYEPGDTLVAQRDTVLTAQWEILQLSFSVPATLAYSVKANGELVAASSEAARITSFTDVGLSVVGARAESARGYVLTPDPAAAGDVDYSFAPVGCQPFTASSAQGEFMPVDWRLPKRSSLVLGEFAGKVALWDEADARPRDIGRIVWKFAVRAIAVTFDPNGAEGQPIRQEANAEARFSAPACGYVHSDGKDFMCWNTAPDGSGRSYQPGDLLAFTGDTTLYALWNEA